MNSKTDDVFVKTLNKINKIRKLINGLTFEQAKEKLFGYNADDDIFNYKYDVDDGIHIVGTITNHNGKPHMLIFHIVLAMKESEIREQVERLK